ncbi:MAG: Alpha/beta hydrolase family protein [Candidatus Methanolliviera sp. GoM_oil]|nr:MAG: Alpha/beta hydrolase family protein [Candidatus Methanolliviera sp. GoM_oil]
MIKNLTFDGKTETLCATLYGEFESERKVILSPPHPLLGGCRCDMRVVEVARELYENGISALCIDYRKNYGGGLGEIEDLRSAIDFFEPDKRKKLGLFGYSFGSLVTSNIDDERVKGVVLISVLSKMGEIAVKVDTTYEKLFIHGRRDYIAPYDEFLEIYNDSLGEKYCKVYDTDHFYAGFIEEVKEEVSKFFLKVFEDY